MILKAGDNFRNICKILMIEMIVIMVMLVPEMAVVMMELVMIIVKKITSFIVYRYEGDNGDVTAEYITDNNHKNSDNMDSIQ